MRLKFDIEPEIWLFRRLSVLVFSGESRSPRTTPPVVGEVGQEALREPSRDKQDLSLSHRCCKDARALIRL